MSCRNRKSTTSLPRFSRTTGYTTRRAWKTPSGISTACWQRASTPGRRNAGHLTQPADLTPAIAPGRVAARSGAQRQPRIEQKLRLLRSKLHPSLRRAPGDQLHRQGIHDLEAPEEDGDSLPAAGVVGVEVLSGNAGAVPGARPEFLPREHFHAQILESAADAPHGLRCIHEDARRLRRHGCAPPRPA